MDRYWLQGAPDYALHALSCGAGYNIRWLLLAIARLGLGGPFCAFSAVLAYALGMLRRCSSLQGPRYASQAASCRWTRCGEIGLGGREMNFAGATS